ncbi:MAG TPA: redoxin domain-containing protein [archaeon]|nr:redoxin domain-containing protein [archaeon]
MKLLTESIHLFEEKNVKLISIASDTTRLLKNFKEQNNFAIDMISDRGAKIAKEYGVYWYAKGFSNIKIKQAVPSKFLIDKNGIIVWKYIGKDKTDRPTVNMMMILIEKYIKNPK